LFKYSLSTGAFVPLAAQDAFPIGAAVENFSSALVGVLGPGAGSPSCLYKVSQTGTFQRIVNFSNFNYGVPTGDIALLPTGYILGTTNGDNSIIYSLSSTGIFKVKYFFDNQTQGLQPSSLTYAPDGKLYGTTTGGDVTYGPTIVSFDPDAFVQSSDPDSASEALATLFHFYSPYSAPGAGKGRPPLYAAGGIITGIVSVDTGGYSLFQFTPRTGSMAYTTIPLKNVDSVPTGYLIQSVTGTIVGLITDSSSGQAFSAPGTPPSPEIQGSSLTSCGVGNNFLVYGRYLLGATSVTINGTPAVFSVTSNGVLQVTVPVGASSGPIVITTPNGSVTSAFNFTVQ
jgi:hypothetical protein